MGLLSPISVPRPNVLVVDDEPTICDAVADALPTIAAKVTIASNTTEAISTLDSGRFDVVLCDLYMPGGGGLDVLQHASRAELDLGFILMTGKPQVNDIVAACRLHAADILLKPFSLESLQTAVQKAYARVFHTRRERIRRNQLRNGLRHRVIQLEDTRRQLRDSYREIIEAMVVILDHREHETCAHSFRVRILADYRPISAPYYAENGTLEHWLTERYCLYTTNSSGRLLRGDIQHEPWPLQHAEAEISLNTMITSMGLPQPVGEPHLLYASSLKVLIWGLVEAE